jgi:hypothetical protein
MLLRCIGPSSAGEDFAGVETMGSDWLFGCLSAAIPFGVGGGESIHGVLCSDGRMRQFDMPADKVTCGWVLEEAVARGFCGPSDVTRPIALYDVDHNLQLDPNMNAQKAFGATGPVAILVECRDRRAADYGPLAAGNKCFKNGRFEDALTKYHELLSYLRLRQQIQMTPCPKNNVSQSTPADLCDEIAFVLAAIGAVIQKTQRYAPVTPAPDRRPLSSLAQDRNLRGNIGGRKNGAPNTAPKGAVADLIASILQETDECNKALSTPARGNEKDNISGRARVSNIDSENATPNVRPAARASKKAALQAVANPSAKSHKAITVRAAKAKSGGKKGGMFKATTKWL